MNGETDQTFRCRTCANLRSEHGKTYCDWLESYVVRSALGGPCEGYVCKESGVKQKRGKDVGNDAGQATQDLEVSYPKTDPTSTVKRPEKAMILTALELKKLKGSVVLERVCCGKRGCHCQSGIGHGPYSYLHFWSQGKVKRRYLCKAVAELMCYSREDLKSLLSEVENARVLGQETSSTEHESKEKEGSLL